MPQELSVELLKWTHFFHPSAQYQSNKTLRYSSWNWGIPFPLRQVFASMLFQWRGMQHVEISAYLFFQRSGLFVGTWFSSSSLLFFFSRSLSLLYSSLQQPICCVKIRLNIACRHRYLAAGRKKHIHFDVYEFKFSYTQVKRRHTHMLTYATSS